MHLASSSSSHRQKLIVEFWRDFCYFASPRIFIRVIVSTPWPLSAQALFHGILLTIIAQLLQGFVGDIVMKVGQIALRWASWWVLP